jgi:hypothetical protein
MKTTITQQGFLALISIAIIATASLIMALGASFIGLVEIESGFNDSKGGEALALSEGCVEETLRRISLDPNYGVGNGAISLNTRNGSCIIEVSANGSYRIIDATGTVGNFTKVLQVVTTVSGGSVTMVSWEEVES